MAWHLKITWKAYPWQHTSIPRNISRNTLYTSHSLSGQTWSYNIIVMLRTLWELLKALSGKPFCNWKNPALSPFLWTILQPVDHFWNYSCMLKTGHFHSRAYTSPSGVGPQSEDNHFFGPQINDASLLKAGDFLFYYTTGALLEFKLSPWKQEYELPTHILFWATRIQFNMSYLALEYILQAKVTLDEKLFQEYYSALGEDFKHHVIRNTDGKEWVAVFPLVISYNWNQKLPVCQNSSFAEAWRTVMIIHSVISTMFSRGLSVYNLS